MGFGAKRLVFPCRFIPPMLFPPVMCVPSRRVSRSRFIQSTAVLPDKRLDRCPMDHPYHGLAYLPRLSPGHIGLALSEERPRKQAGVLVESDGDGGFPWIHARSSSIHPSYGSKGPIGCCVLQTLPTVYSVDAHTDSMYGVCMYLAAGREGLAAPACNVTLTSLGSLSSSRQVAGCRYMQPSQGRYQPGLAHPGQQPTSSTR